MRTEQLLQRLRRLRGRLLGVSLIAGLGWGLVAAALALLFCAWLDLLWELPPELRLGAGGAAVGLGVLLIAAAGGLALAHGRLRRLARRLDEAGASAGQIVTGIDLALEPRPGAPMTLVLAAMAIERAGELALGIPGARAVPWRPALRAFGSVVLLAAAVAVGALTAPRLATTQWLRFTDPFGDHPPYSRVLYDVQPGDVAVVYAAGFDVQVTTEGPPVERLDLVLSNRVTGATETLPMFPEGNGAWRASVNNVTWDGTYLVKSHAGRSRHFRIDVITVPRLEDVRFRITPPAYTNRPPYDGPLPQGGLAGLPGATVQMWAKSNRPLAGGSIEIHAKSHDATVPLTPVSPDSHEVSGTFVIRAAGQIHLKVTDTAGQDSSEPWSAAIVLLADEPPSIRLIEPRPQSFATPSAALPVVLGAEDDYGVARVQLFRSLNDSRALPLEVTIPNPAPVRWSGTVVLPLSSYGLAPGDEVKVFARVEDTNPAGPGTAETPVAVVRIISQEDFERMVRVREGMEAFLSRYRQAQRRAEKMAEEVERLHKKVKDLPADSAAGKEAEAELSRLADRFRQEAAALQKAASRSLPYDLDQALRKHLERTAQRLEDHAKQARALAASGMSAGELAQALKRMMQDLGGLQRELNEQVIEPLEHLASVFPLLEDAARFELLHEWQKDLAERLGSVKGQDPPKDPSAKQRMRGLQTEQASIRADLLRLLDDIEDHVTQLPDDAKFEKLRQEAADFARAVRGSGAAEAMTEAEKGLGELSGTRGHASARKALEILEKFLARARGGSGMQSQGEMCLRFQPTLRDGLGNTLGQMLAELGLQSGMGPQGGSGYSTRRNTLDNVGMYGALPTSDETESAGGGTRSSAGKKTQGKAGPASSRAMPDAIAPANAAGAAEAMIPWSYRHRVAEYFQRIADEAGRK